MSGVCTDWYLARLGGFARACCLFIMNFIFSIELSRVTAGRVSLSLLYWRAFALFPLLFYFSPPSALFIRISKRLLAFPNVYYLGRHIAKALNRSQLFSFEDLDPTREPENSFEP